MLDILFELLGPHVHKKGNNNAYRCPFCLHPKFKMEVNIELGHWHCWVCNSRGKSIYSLFKKMNAAPIYFEKIKPFFKKNILIQSDKDESVKPIILPNAFKPLYINDNSFFYNKAKNYFVSVRKLTELDILKYNIGYADEGSFSNRLIFPNYNSDNILNYYTSRSYVGANSFLNIAMDRNIIGFENHINWKLPLGICESAINAITMRINFTPMYGKFMSNKLRLAILNNKVSEIYLCLDPDAIIQTLDYIEYLISLGIDIYFIKFPENKDCNDLGYETVWNIISNTPKTTESDLYYLKIKQSMNDR